jgi:uncharacterized coiled-coil protein SlyX
VYIGAVAALALSASAVGQTGSESSIQSLEQRIAELEARDARSQAVISDLQGQVNALDGEGWVDEQRSQEVRALVSDVLADADTRGSLLQDGGTAGWNDGFYLSSADGNYSLRLSGQIQFRYVLSMQDNSGDAATGNDDNRGGFEVSRLRLGLKGHVFDPSWKYFVWLGWNNSNATLGRDIWIKKSLDNGWTLQAGQFKTEALREWTVPETKMQFVERSLIDARYGGSFTQGIAAEYKNDDWRVNVQLHDGIRNRDTPYSVNPGPSTATYQAATEYALGVRGEYKMWGQWADYADWEGWRGGEGLGVVGGSLYVQKGEVGTAANESQILQWTVDASFKWDGFNVFGAIFGHSIDDDAGQDRDELAVLIQGGYFVSDDIELIGRYEWGDLDGAGTVSQDLSILTLGVNKFWDRHAIKWTTDVGIAFDTVDAAWGGRGAGFRPDGVGEDGQIVLRSQLQLLF